MFVKRLAIDLGTINTRIYLSGRDIVINEPSVVAIEAVDNKVMAIGQEAKEMLGRTPESIIASHPLKDGAIANYRTTQTMLQYYINKLAGRVRFFKPDLMIAIPAGVTSTERRAVIDAALSAGAKNAYVITAKKTCSPCLRRKCPDPTCFLQITPQMIFDVINKNML